MRRYESLEGRCVFLGEDLLCRIHKVYGFEKSPDVAKNFPSKCFGPSLPRFVSALTQAASIPTGRGKQAPSRCLRATCSPNRVGGSRPAHRSLIFASRCTSTSDHRRDASSHGGAPYACLHRASSWLRKSTYSAGPSRSVTTIHPPSGARLGHAQQP